MARRKKQQSLATFVEDLPESVEEPVATVEAEPKREKKKEKEKEEHSSSVDWKSQLMFSAIVLLSLTVITLLLVMASNQAPFKVALDKFNTNYPAGVLSVQTFSGADAEAMLPQLAQACPGMNSKEFYLVQVASKNSASVSVFVFDTSKGKLLCTFGQDLQQGNSAISPQLLATVNEEPVYVSDVLMVYNGLPESSRNNDGLRQSFEQVVNRKLLLQEAKKNGITISQEELDASVGQFLSQNGLTVQSLEERLRQSNMTLAQFGESVAADLIVQKVSSAIVSTAPVTTDADAKGYYDSYKQNITTVPSSVTRQMTFFANESTAAAKLEYAKQVAGLINQTNFCEVVKQFSEDVSTRDNCGLYSAKAGELLPEYEEAVFSMGPGERKAFGSRVGFHIVEVVEVNKARMLTFEESKNDIKQYLTLARQQMALTEYLTKLRNEAKIVDYSSQQPQ